MAIYKDFQTFCESLKLKNRGDMETTAGEIAKKLNKSYYNLDGNKEEHVYIVGSVGRETAISGSSDLDIIFDLPNSTYKKFDDYESNGQSALLQEVRNILKERYPKTDISGDGQVVVIEFINYTVELVPGFKQGDGSFKYPDTHDGGRWKTTNPTPEIDESKKSANETGGNFTNICYMLRSWKNKKGFIFGGLLIDTLVYNFLKDNIQYKTIGYISYLGMLKELFKYLKGLDKSQSYWFALGSNQHIYNSDNGKFVDEAEDVYDEIKDLTNETEDLNSILRGIFGNKFPKVTSTEQASINKSYNMYSYTYRDTEEFIEERFPVDIRFSLTIECRVTQNGWRDRLLRHMLSNKEWLSTNKQLNFYIDKVSVEQPYDIYWKVKNEGEVAKSKDQIRGQIKKTNKVTHFEVTSFRGEHYVECYIVKNGVCVARSRITVPITAN